MNGSEMAVPAGALMRVLVFLLYAPVCLAVFRWSIPRLSLSYRFLAIAMLAAQVVILVVGLEDIPRWETTGWLWHLDQEWNIPSTFASMQLALVSAAALVTALLARARPTFYRLYLVGLGLFFLILARDEYYSWHEINLVLELVYIALGIAIVVATLIVAARSPRRARIGHVLLLTGMALNVIGAMLVDRLPQVCNRLVFVRLEGCLRLYNLEESLEFLGVWLVLVAILGKLSDAAPRARRLVRLFLFVLPVFWMLLLTSDAWRPRLELRFRAQPASIEFESGLRLQGYSLDWNREAIAIWLYPSAWRSRYDRLGFSVHLVDQASGQSVASHNRHAQPQFHLLLAPGYAHVYRQRIAVEIPAETPANRAYWITLSVWLDEGDEFVSQKVLESDHQLLNETQLILGELVFPTPSAVSFVPLAEFGGGIHARHS